MRLGPLILNFTFRLGTLKGVARRWPNNSTSHGVTRGPSIF